LSFQNEYSEIVAKYIEEEKNLKVIKYNVRYEESIRYNFVKAYGTEGLEYINQEILKKQRNVLSHMLKKMGANFLQGKSIMNVSLPVNIFDSRSTLEA
jgi:hypothetical protein